MMLLMILLIPLLIPFLSKIIWPHHIQWKEMAIHIVIVLVVTSGMYFAGMYKDIIDKEVWNGEVVAKKKEVVDCEHSYSCNCITIKVGDSNITTCQTCYDHDYDIDWAVYTNIEPRRITIDRIDRQGLKEPPRWSAIYLNEPFSWTHNYVNYIKSTPESLFNKSEQYIEYQHLIPEYPIKMFDYWHVNRVLSMGVKVEEHNKWNDELHDMLKKVGPRYKANGIIVFVNTKNPDYVHALEKAWLGGKKNDVILVLGVTEWPKLEFARVISWSKDKMIISSLRDRIEIFEDINREYVLNTLKEEIMFNFQRMNMEDYEYLKDEIEPSLNLIIICLIVSICLSCGVTYFFHQNEL